MQQKLIVHNLDTDRPLMQDGRVARTALARAIGLLGAAAPRPGQGLWLVPCNSVHMFFMGFALDVIFLDARQQVVHLIEGLQPWRISPIVWQSRSVIELPVGVIARSGTRVGHRLQMTEVEW